ncbi:MAG TPA: hypothetical protein VGP89_18070 [Candidatus Angelobacter sp.]|jgi:hypothetical protein|nr:hypothetical protein [Candidatus Angelobacter sp.]
MPETEDYTSSDQPMTLGQRLLRTRGAAALEDDPTGEPSAGATPNTKEPHQNTGAAAQGDSVAQSPSGKPSIGRRMLMGSSQPTDGITAHNYDGSPADMATFTGTDPKGRPAMSIAASAPATSTSVPAPATAPTIGQRLANFKAPPVAPKMNPDQAAVQQDLREHSQVTPKTDPATGKTLDQYKMGFGQRLLGSLVNFGNGFARTGADPIHVGPGATNRRYSVDETNRQQRVAGDQSKIKSMDDEYNQAEKGYGHELTSYNDEARAAGKADSEDRLRDYENKLTTERTAHNTAEENLRGENNDLKAQPKTYEQYVGAMEAEKDPGKKAVLQRVVDRLEKQKTAGKGPKLSAKDQLKLDAYMQDNKIEDVGDMTNADIKKALAASEGPNHTKDRQSFEDHWSKRYQDVEKRYDSQRQAVLKTFGADKDPKAFENNKADIQSKFADIEAKREADKGALQTEKDKEAEQYQVYGKPPKQQTATPSAPADGPEAVPASNDSDGQPLAAIPAPIASVRTGAPQQKPSPATPADSVRVQKPDGSIGTIPKANVQRAQAKGWKVLQ